MPFARFFAVAVLALGASVSSAQASIITLNFNFSVTDFADVPFFVDPAPVDPVTGSFSVTFDNATDLIDVTTGVSMTSLNIDLGSPLVFSYFSLLDEFVIGGLSGGASGVAPGTDDFALPISSVSTNPFIRFTFFYTQEEDLDSVWESRNVTLTSNGGAAVPEPSTLTLLGFGLAGIVVRRLRQRRA